MDYLHSFLLRYVYRPRRLTRQIIQHAVHPFDLIDDPRHTCLQNAPGYFTRFRRHKIRGEDRPEHDRIVIGPSVAHDAHAPHIGEGRKVLSEHSVCSGPRKLIPEDLIRFLDDPDLLLRDLTDDTHAKSRARERLSVYQISRYTELNTKLPHLILEQHAERFYDLPEIDMIRETS